MVMISVSYGAKLLKDFVVLSWIKSWNDYIL